MGMLGKFGAAKMNRSLNRIPMPGSESHGYDTVTPEQLKLFKWNTLNTRINRLQGEGYTPERLDAARASSGLYGKPGDAIYDMYFRRYGKAPVAVGNTGRQYVGGREVGSTLTTPSHAELLGSQYQSPPAPEPYLSGEASNQVYGGIPKPGDYGRESANAMIRRMNRFQPPSSTPPGMPNATLDYGATSVGATRQPPAPERQVQEQQSPQMPQVIPGTNVSAVRALPSGASRAEQIYRMAGAPRWAIPPDEYTIPGTIDRQWSSGGGTPTQPTSSVLPGVQIPEVTGVFPRTISGAIRGQDFVRRLQDDIAFGRTPMSEYDMSRLPGGERIGTDLITLDDMATARHEAGIGHPYAGVDPRARRIASMAFQDNALREQVRKEVEGRMAEQDTRVGRGLANSEWRPGEQEAPATDTARSRFGGAMTYTDPATGRAKFIKPGNDYGGGQNASLEDRFKMAQQNALARQSLRGVERQQPKSIGLDQYRDYRQAAAEDRYRDTLNQYRQNRMAGRGDQYAKDVADRAAGRQAELAGRSAQRFENAKAEAAQRRERIAARNEPPNPLAVMAAQNPQLALGLAGLNQQGQIAAAQLQDIAAGRKFAAEQAELERKQAEVLGKLRNQGELDVAKAQAERDKQISPRDQYIGAAATPDEAADRAVTWDRLHPGEQQVQPGPAGGIQMPKPGDRLSNADRAQMATMDYYAMDKFLIGKGITDPKERLEIKREFFPNDPGMTETQPGGTLAEVGTDVAFPFMGAYNILRSWIEPGRETAAYRLGRGMARQRKNAPLKRPIEQWQYGF